MYERGSRTGVKAMKPARGGWGDEGLYLYLGVTEKGEDAGGELEGMESEGGVCDEYSGVATGRTRRYRI